MKYVIAIICLFLITGCSDDTPATATTVEAETTVPEPAKVSEHNEFVMDVEDFFIMVDGRVVVTGQITSGTVATGDMICVSSNTDGKMKAEVIGIEQFNKVIQQAGVGDQVGIMLGGVEKNRVGKGDRLSNCPSPTAAIPNLP